LGVRTFNEFKMKLTWVNNCDIKIHGNRFPKTIYSNISLIYVLPQKRMLVQGLYVKNHLGMNMCVDK